MASDKTRLFTTWSISSLLAFWLIFAGVPKLWGGLGWATRFTEWGYPTWMMSLTGLAEITGSILILIPRLAAIGGAILAMVMLGALITQLIFNGIAGAVPPLVAIMMAGAIVGLRWNDTFKIRQESRRDEPRIMNDPNI